MHTWPQVYFLFGQGLGISALLAALPILTLLFLLGILRKPAWIAGLTGLALTLALVLGVYRMPPAIALGAVANAAAFALFPITWIIFWAIALFRITVDTGHFEIIKDSIGHLTTDKRLQAILIAFAFGGFLESAAGFGAPVAIAATMLIGLGFSPFSAAALCLLANTAPVAFGSIGIPILTLSAITGLPLVRLGAATGRLCAPIALFIPVYLVAALGGFASLSGVLFPALLSGATYALVQLIISALLGPQLAGMLGSLAAIAALIVSLRVLRPTHESETSAPHARFAAAVAVNRTEAELSENSIPHHTASAILHAWMPYGILVTCVLVWGLPPVQAALGHATLLLHWPLLHNAVLRMPPVVSAPAPYPALFNFNWLAAPGTACMAATLLTAAALRVTPRAFAQVLVHVTRQLALPTVTVASVLGVAFLMNYSGATATLGLAFSATGALFPFFSPLLGWLGVFLTGSDTSANALFGNLQVVTSTRLGLDPVLMAAANSTGGVMGKMISLQTIAIATAATGLPASSEGKLFRFTIRHSILLTVIVGLLTLLYAYVLPFR